jgi:hypothetical protein
VLLGVQSGHTGCAQPAAAHTAGLQEWADTTNVSSDKCAGQSVIAPFPIRTIQDAGSQQCRVQQACKHAQTQQLWAFWFAKCAGPVGWSNPLLWEHDPVSCATLLFCAVEASRQKQEQETPSLA